jgi:hypothetical protein
MPIYRPMQSFFTQIITNCSAELLSNPHGHVQSYEDGLESFMWVLLWICLCYLPHELSANKDSLQTIINSIFDDRMTNGAGGLFKISYLTRKNLIPWGFSMTGNKPLTVLLQNLCRLFGCRYMLDVQPWTYQAGPEPVQHPPSAPTSVKIEEVMSCFELALQSTDWPDINAGDIAKPQLPDNKDIPSIYIPVVISSAGPSQSDSGVATSLTHMIPAQA